MAKYWVIGSQATISSSYKGIAAFYAPATPLKRARCAEIIIGQTANPNSTDTYVQYDMSRQTTVGTATVLAAPPSDPADGAASTLASSNTTVEPTITASSSVFNEAVNQRGSFRWIESDENKMPVIPLTANNGFELRGQSSTYASSVTATLGFFE